MLVCFFVLANVCTYSTVIRFHCSHAKIITCNEFCRFNNSPIKDYYIALGSILTISFLFECFLGSFFCLDIFQ